MNSYNKSNAWMTKVPSSLNMPGRGIPWVNEEPTLVIGISLSHGLGQDSITVVGASVGLDVTLMQIAQLCRVQSKSGIIAPDIMKNLTKVNTKLHLYV